MTNKVRIIGEDGYMDTNMMALEPDNVDGDFLHFLIDHIGLYRIADTSTIPQINNKHIEPYELLIPRIDEQATIADLFVDLDNLITLQQRKLKKTKNLKSAYLSKMFPREGKKYPELRFAGFTDAWELRKLSDIVVVGSGRDYKHLGEGNIPVYGTGGYMLSVDEALSYDSDAIGIGRKGTIDKPYLLKAPFWTVDTLFYCIPRQNFDLQFTLQLLKKVDWKQKDESTGVPSLSKETINMVEAMAPDLNEQKQIGQYFKAIDNLITLHQRKLDKLKNIKQAYLNEMFV
jgi:type I restriction enzyme S subunit